MLFVGQAVESSVAVDGHWSSGRFVQRRQQIEIVFQAELN